jgi:hypothetical protein
MKAIEREHTPAFCRGLVYFIMADTASALGAVPEVADS